MSDNGSTRNMMLALAGLGVSVATLWHFTARANADQRRRQWERRCEGWRSLDLDRVIEHYERVVSSDTSYSTDYYECLAIELEERGYPAEAQELWRMLVEHQASPKNSGVPGQERCPDWINLADNEILSHYQATLMSQTPLDEQYISCLSKELHARGYREEAAEILLRHDAAS